MRTFTLLAAMLAATIAAACASGEPGASREPVSGACLERPGASRAPNGVLPCELFPPGMKAR